MLRPSALPALAFAAVLAVAAAPAAALDIRQTLWGFDGRIVPGRINPVSVQLDNPSDRPFDGEVSCSLVAMGSRAGERIVQNVFLAPFSSRWAQFYVFVHSGGDDWRVEWGPGPGEHFDLPQPQVGPPAVVMLDDPDRPTAMRGPVRVFPEGLFPPSVSAIDTLGEVVLDHAPRMDPARRQALADWLRRGGVVHLLEASSPAGAAAAGGFPRFGDELSALDNPLDRFNVGAGIVIRHAATARQITPADLKAGATSPTDEGNVNTYAGWEADSQFFQFLGAQTRPHHNWPVIYLLIVAYLLAVGPVNLLVGRKVRDYRVSIVFLLASVAGFSAVFFFLGRRGYGEATTVNTMTYARPLGDGRYDLTQWTNVFVTSGDYYAITHEGPHQVYATAQYLERVNGAAVNGKDGRLLVDIPLYSSRSFLHRGVVQADGVTLESPAWTGTGPTAAFSATLAGAGDEPLEEVWAVYRGEARPLNVRGRRLEMPAKAGQPLAQAFPQSEVFQALQAAQWNTLGPPYGEAQDTNPPPAVERFRPLAKPVIAKSVGTLEGRSPPPRLDDDRLQVFVFAPSPAAFGVRGRGLGHEAGYTVYHFIVPGPGDADPTRAPDPAVEEEAR